jgi:hypothetical protein
MESKYWEHYWAERRAREAAASERHTDAKRRRPSVIGRGKSGLTYWQRHPPRGDGSGREPRP